MGFGSRHPADLAPPSAGLSRVGLSASECVAAFRATDQVASWLDRVARWRRFMTNALSAFQPRILSPTGRPGVPRRSGRACRLVPWTGLHMIGGPVTIRLLLVDGHEMVLTRLRQAMTDEGFDVVGEARDGRDAVRLAGQLQPDVVVMDVAMLEVEGAETGRLIRQRFPTIQLLLTMIADCEELARSMRVPASGYLVKDSSTDEIAEAIRDVAEGRTALSCQLAASILEVVWQLRQEEISQSLDLMIGRAVSQLERQGIGLELTQAAKDLLARRGDDPTLGAQALRRAFQRNVEDPISERLLWREVHAGETIVVEAVDNGVTGRREIAFRAIEGFQLANRLDWSMPPEEVGVITRREEEMLQLIANGFSASEAAEKLSMSDNRVKEFLGSICEKLDARVCTEAVRGSVGKGLVERDGEEDDEDGSDDDDGSAGPREPRRPKPSGGDESNSALVLGGQNAEP